MLKRLDLLQQALDAFVLRVRDEEREQPFADVFDGVLKGKASLVQLNLGRCVLDPTVKETRSSIVVEVLSRAVIEDLRPPVPA